MNIHFHTRDSVTDVIVDVGFCKNHRINLSLNPEGKVTTHTCDNIYFYLPEKVRGLLETNFKGRCDDSDNPMPSECIICLSMICKELTKFLNKKPCNVYV